MARLIFLVSELGGLKVEVSWAYNGECNIICNAICDMTGATQGVVLLGSVRGTPEGVRKKFGEVNLSCLRIMNHGLFMVHDSNRES